MDNWYKRRAIWLLMSERRGDMALRDAFLMGLGEPYKLGEEPARKAIERYIKSPECPNYTGTISSSCMWDVGVSRWCACLGLTGYNRESEYKNIMSGIVKMHEQLSSEEENELAAVYQGAPVDISKLKEDV